jgi:hypothetical protein
MRLRKLDRGSAAADGAGCRARAVTRRATQFAVGSNSRRLVPRTTRARAPREASCSHLPRACAGSSSARNTGRSGLAGPEPHRRGVHSRILTVTHSPSPSLSLHAPRRGGRRPRRQLHGIRRPDEEVGQEVNRPRPLPHRARASGRRGPAGPGVDGGGSGTLRSPCNKFETTFSPHYTSTTLPALPSAHHGGAGPP